MSYFRESNHQERTSSSSSAGSGSSRKSKKSGSDKPKQPQRGLGVAQLEKIRLHSQMGCTFLPDSLHHNPFDNNLSQATKLLPTTTDDEGSASPAIGEGSASPSIAADQLAHRLRPSPVVEEANVVLYMFGSYRLGVRSFLQCFTVHKIIVLQNLDISNVSVLYNVGQILKLVLNVENFRTTLRCVKFWAKKSGIYSNV